jgi:hypothetical protein
MPGHLPGGEGGGGAWLTLLCIAGVNMVVVRRIRFYYGVTRRVEAEVGEGACVKPAKPGASR